MIHVTPPQRAPEFVADSPLADQAGYLEIDQTTLRHARYPNIFGLGDSASTPNAKTAAAARQCPDVRHQRRDRPVVRSEEHTSELQSLMRISYAVFCLKKKKKQI